MPVVINSKFTPLTYDEITKPLIQETEAQTAMEDTYAEVSDKASEIMAKANQQTDPIAYNRLKFYAEDLQKQADALMSRGLQSGSRQALLDMRRRYGTEITPIKSAIERREEMTKLQREAMAKDQTVRFDRDFRTMSLDELLTNPQASFETLSGAQIAKMTSDAVSNYAKSIMSNPQMSKVMGSQYWQVRQQAGYTPQQILAEASGDPNAPQELRAVRESIHSQLKGNAAYDEDWVNSYINMGMSSAVGKTSIDFSPNKDYLSAAERAANERAKERLEYEKSRSSFKGSKPEDWVPIEGDDTHVWDPKTQSIRNKNTGAIVLNPETGSKTNPYKTAASQNVDRASLLVAQPIYFKGDSGDKADESNFDMSDAKKYPASKLTPKQKAAINKQASLLGLTIDDVDVYVDEDWYGRDVYKVVPKGYSVDGTAPEELNFE